VSASPEAAGDPRLHKQRLACDPLSMAISDELAAESVWGTADRQLAAIMAVSRAVADGQELEETLDHIAEAAAFHVGARATAIILRVSETGPGLMLAGQHGLRREFLEQLVDGEPIKLGQGVSGLAAATGEIVAVEDTLSDERLAPWRTSLMKETFRAFIAVPLTLHDGRVIGAMNVYRDEVGPWDEQERVFLRALADHAAIATRTANLLDETRRQVEGLSLLVRSLRAQGHEHSNRLHTIYGLLALGEVDQARRLIGAVEDQYHSSYAQVTARIENPVVAGFIVAEAGIARHSGIELTVDRRSRLTTLPPSVSDLDAVTVIGNLVHNAIDAVSEMAPSRRKVTVKIRETRASLVIAVRDRGNGVDEAFERRMFEPHASTKEGHAGIGLALVRGVALRAGGRVSVEHPASGGLEVIVEVPR
jgi:signal transduction histidine kinase